MDGSGSMLDNLAACPAMGALPFVETPVGEAAARGTAIHKYLQTGTVQDGYEADCEAIDYEQAVPVADSDNFDLREITYCWNPETKNVQVLGINLDRDYSACRYPCVPITLDRVFLKNGTWWVVDYKTGEPPPPDTLQLRFGAVCVAKVMKLREVRVAIVHINKKGKVWWSPGAGLELDSIDLSLAEREVSNIVRRVQEARDKVSAGISPDVRTGPHCEYCGATASCPAYSGLVARTVDTGADFTAAIAVMPSSRLPEAELMCKKAEQQVEAIKAAIRLRLKKEGGEIVGPKGRLVTVPVQRPHIIAEKAEAVFQAFGIEPKKSVSFKIGDVREAAGEQAQAVEETLFEKGALVYKDTPRVLLKKE